MTAYLLYRCKHLIMLIFRVVPLSLNISIYAAYSRCGGLEMAPHENKWSPLDGAHKLQVTVIVTTSELS